MIKTPRMSTVKHILTVFYCSNISYTLIFRRTKLFTGKKFRLPVRRPSLLLTNSIVSSVDKKTGRISCLAKVSSIMTNVSFFPNYFFTYLSLPMKFRHRNNILSNGRFCPKKENGSNLIFFSL